MEEKIKEIALHVMKETKKELIEKIEKMPDSFNKKDILESLSEK